MQRAKIQKLTQRATRNKAPYKHPLKKSSKNQQLQLNYIPSTILKTSTIVSKTPNQTMRYNPANPPIPMSPKLTLPTFQQTIRHPRFPNKFPREMKILRKLQPTKNCGPLTNFQQNLSTQQPFSPGLQSPMVFLASY